MMQTFFYDKTYENNKNHPIFSYTNNPISQLCLTFFFNMQSNIIRLNLLCIDKLDPDFKPPPAFSINLSTPPPRVEDSFEKNRFRRLFFLLPFD